jgi:methionine aminotransferase
VLEETDMQALEEIVNEFGLYIISDEVYEHLIFDEKKHHSVIKYPTLYARSFACYSFGKVYHCTGWKLGYCVAPPELMKEFRKIHQFNCFSCNAPVQYALSEILKAPAHYLELGKMLQHKRDYLKDRLKETPLKPLPSYGSYFQLYSYEGVDQANEHDYAVKLTKEAGVTTIPVSAFISIPQYNKVLRFCFAKKEETLDVAAERLMKYYQKEIE